MEFFWTCMKKNTSLCNDQCCAGRMGVKNLNVAVTVVSGIFNWHFSVVIRLKVCVIAKFIDAVSHECHFIPWLLPCMCSREIIWCFLDDKSIDFLDQILHVDWEFIQCWQHLPYFKVNQKPSCKIDFWSLSRLLGKLYTWNMIMYSIIICFVLP